MKVIIEKEDFVNAQKAVKKISPDSSVVYLKTNEEDNTLSIISKSAFFVNYIIPAVIEVPGIIALNKALFETLSNLRGKNLKMESVGNSLNITCGSKVSLFCNEVNSEDLVQPSVKKNKKVLLNTTSVATFKNMVANCTFGSLDSYKEKTPIKIENNESGFHVRVADYVHCAFYNYKKGISDNNFSFITYIDNLKNVIPFLNDKSKLLIDDSLMLLKSSNIITTLPSVQDSEAKEIESASEFINDDKYSKETIVFNRKGVLETLSSISVISEGVDVLKIDIDKEAIICSLRTSFGTSKDKIKFISNSFKNTKLEIPLLMFKGALESCNTTDEVTFHLSKNNNYYRLYAESDSIICHCVAPVGTVK